MSLHIRRRETAEVLSCLVEEICSTRIKLQVRLMNGYEALDRTLKKECLVEGDFDSSSLLPSIRLPGLDLGAMDDIYREDRKELFVVYRILVRRPRKVVGPPPPPLS